MNGFCDTIFLVNNSKFHASSHLVGVFSPVLFNMIENQHENCGDREVKLTEIQLDPSFSILLDYIYGISLNTPEVDINVLCEALLVSERFEVKSFSEKLKCYLSGLKIYHIDYLAVLLNTAKKFQLVELYQKLRDFACNNSEQFLKHRNFVNLKFDVLKELIQLDTFGTAEINILSGILAWHNYNMHGDNLTFEDEVLQNGACLDLEVDIEEIENDDSKSNGNLITLFSTPVNKEIVDTFRKNVLKSLLCHVRMCRISMLEIFQASSKLLFTNYKEYLLQGDYFSQSSVPRNPLVQPIVEPCIDQFDVTKKFTIVAPLFKGMYKSSEVYALGDISWTVWLEFGQIPIPDFYHNYCTVYLKGACREFRKCKGDFAVVVSHQNYGQLSLYSTSDLSIKPFETSTQVAVFKLNINEYLTFFELGKSCPFEVYVHFKCSYVYS